MCFYAIFVIKTSKLKKGGIYVPFTVKSCITLSIITNMYNPRRFNGSRHFLSCIDVITWIFISLFIAQKGPPQKLLLLLWTTQTLFLFQLVTSTVKCVFSFVLDNELGIYFSMKFIKLWNLWINKQLSGIILMKMFFSELLTSFSTGEWTFERAMFFSLSRSETRSNSLFKSICVQWTQTTI